MHESHRIEEDVKKSIHHYEGNDVIINLQDVISVSSSGIKLILSVMKQVKEYGGKLKLCSFSPSVFEILDAVGLSDMIEFYQDEAKAL